MAREAGMVLLAVLVLLSANVSAWRFSLGQSSRYESTPNHDNFADGSIENSGNGKDVAVFGKCLDGAGVERILKGDGNKNKRKNSGTSSTKKLDPCMLASLSKIGLIDPTLEFDKNHDKEITPLCLENVEKFKTLLEEKLQQLNKKNLFDLGHDHFKPVILSNEESTGSDNIEIKTNGDIVKNYAELTSDRSIRRQTNRNYKPYTDSKRHSNTIDDATILMTVLDNKKLHGKPEYLLFLAKNDVYSSKFIKKIFRTRQKILEIIKQIGHHEKDNIKKNSQANHDAFEQVKCISEPSISQETREECETEISTTKNHKAVTLPTTKQHQTASTTNCDTVSDNTNKNSQANHDLLEKIRSTTEPLISQETSEECETEISTTLNHKAVTLPTTKQHQTASTTNCDTVGDSTNKDSQANHDLLEKIRSTTEPLISQETSEECETEISTTLNHKAVTLPTTKQHQTASTTNCDTVSDNTNKDSQANHDLLEKIRSTTEPLISQETSEECKTEISTTENQKTVTFSNTEQHQTASKAPTLDCEDGATNLKPLFLSVYVPLSIQLDPIVGSQKKQYIIKDISIDNNNDYPSLFGNDQNDQYDLKPLFMNIYVPISIQLDTIVDSGKTQYIVKAISIDNNSGFPSLFGNNELMK